MPEPSTSIVVAGLTAISAPVTKLVESVAEFIAAERAPARRVAMANAEAASAVIASDTSDALADRAAARLAATALRQQRNVESVVHKAGEVLTQMGGSVSPDPVSRDWLAEFFRQCENVSDDMMQSLWAKLLAGEVVRPGRFSLRALDVVRVLRKEDADIFTLACRYAVRFSDGKNVLLASPGPARCQHRGGLNYDAILCLADSGLLTSHTVNLEIMQEDLVEYFGHRFELKSSTTQIVSVIRFTTIGDELAPLSGALEDANYLDEVRREVEPFIAPPS